MSFFLKNILILLFIISYNSFGQEKIIIDSDSKAYNNHYNLSEFYFVHNIFADAFFMTDLYKQLDYDEMTLILKEVLYKISSENNVLVTVKQETGADAKLLFYTIEGTKDGTILVLMTNFHGVERVFTEQVDENKSITRWYFVRDDKIVYRKNIFSEELEKEKLSQNSYSIIGYYLFDDKVENDNKILGLIENVLNDNDSDEISKLYAKLYLGQYYLMNLDFENASKQIKLLKQYFENHKDKGIPSQYSLIVEMGETELEIMKRM